MTITIQVSDAVAVTDQTEDPVKVGIAINRNSGIEVATII